MKKYPLITFFTAVFLLPWIVWLSVILNQHNVINWHIPQPLAFWIGLPLATYAVASIVGGKRAVLDIIKRLYRVKVKPLWHVAALATTAIIGAISIIIFVSSGGNNVEFINDATPVSLLLILLFNIWLFLITEETAWRGFALPRLQKRFSPLYASIILGLVWGVWHLPLFFINESFQSSIPFVGFIVSILATSVITTWIFNHSRGSVLVSAIFHGATDVAILYLGVMSSDIVLFWIFVGLQVCVATALGFTNSLRYKVENNKELLYD